MKISLENLGIKLLHLLRDAQNILLRILVKLIGLSRPSKDFRVICIHRVGQIGDLFCSFSAINFIKRKYPNSHLILLTSPGANLNTQLIDLLSSINWIDELIAYKSNSSEFSRLYKTLINKKIDLWVSLPQDRTNLIREFRNMIFARLIGARHGMGFEINVIPWFEKFQSKKITSIAEIERLRKIVGAHNTSCEMITPSLFGDEILDSKKLIEDLKLSKDKPIMILAPGSNRETNMWPIENFIEITHRWVMEGGQVLLVGGKKEVKLGEKITKSNDQSCVFNFIDKLSLKQTYALMKTATVFVGNDSGPMHIAAYANIPCVVAFSARDYPFKWYPAGGNHKIIRKDVPCSPCVAETCRHDILCLRIITIEEVWNGAARYLKENIYTNDRLF